MVTACANERCLRVLGSVAALRQRAMAFYAQAMAGQEEEQRTWQKSEAEVEQRCALIQRLLPQLLTAHSQRPCRSAGAGSSAAACSRLYCSASCEEDSWQRNHSLLCCARHAPLSAFFAERNTARNPDVQVAAQIIAAFVSEVAASQPAPAMEAPAPAVAAQIDLDRVRSCWERHTSYAAQPWSSVLALQSVSSQLLDGAAVPLSVLHAHLRSLRMQDITQAAVAAKKAGSASPSVTTVGPALTPDAVAAAPAPLSNDDKATLAALNSTQTQYRAALQGGFTLLQAALLSTPDAAAQASKHMWS